LITEWKKDLATEIVELLINEKLEMKS